MYIVNYYTRLVLHMYMKNLLWMLFYSNLELGVCRRACGVIMDMGRTGRHGWSMTRWDPILFVNKSG